MIFLFKENGSSRKFLCFCIIVLAEIYFYLYIIFPNKKITSKKKLKNSYMTMTLKMKVFSYKSLIMCEFNCFVYPQEHWK